MRRHVATLVAALAAALLAGCGGGGSGSATDDALSFMPKDAPLAVAFQTDPNSDQYKQVNKLLGRFPFGGQIKQQFKNGLSSSGYDFDKDVKPVLGNDFVVTVPTAAALQQSNTPAIGALKAKDEGKAEELVKKKSTKVGTAEGTDVYRSGSDTFLAVKDGVLVVTDSMASMQDAMKRHSGGDHMTSDDLDAMLAGVEGEDGLARVGVNLQAVIAADPKAKAVAQKVKWVGGLRKAGITAAARSDGIEENFKVTTEGVSEADLPLAPGAQAAPVVRRASDIGFGTRDLGQVVRFFESVGQATDQRGFARFTRNKAQFNRTLGIDVDRDVIDQLEGDAAVSVGIDGGFAARSGVKDPAAFKATLRKAVPKLPKAARGKPVRVAVPKSPNGFYTLAAANGKTYSFAVIGDKFVVATDAARAAQFAGQSASPVPGAKGSLVTALDARTIANQVAGKAGQAGASFFTGALGDATGWVDTETSGMTGRFKLTIK